MIKIRAFRQQDKWGPTYERQSEENKKAMDRLALPVEEQCEKFIAEESNNQEVTPFIVISVNVTTEISGGMVTPIKSKTVLYLTYKQ